MRSVVVLLVLLVIGQSQAGESAESRRLSSTVDDYVSAFHRNKDFSGVVAVSRQGETPVLRAFGYRQLSTRRPISVEDTFHIASISKTFTAAAIRRLVEQKQLALDDPLSKFLPDFPRAKDIAIRQLLSHSSGVPDYWALKGADARAKQPITLGELIAWLAEQPLDFEPGAGSGYSNSGYAVAAAVIENVAGRDFHGFLKNEILRPAGLTDTGEFRLDADVTGYQPAFGSAGIEPAARYDPSILVGAGSLKSSAADLLSWCRLFNDDFNEPSTPTFLFGWGAREKNGRQWVEQSGRNPGFAAHIRAYPREGLCIVVLSNIESDAVSVIGGGLAEIAAEKSVSAPEPRQWVQLERSKLEDYVGTYRIAPDNHIEVARVEAGLVLRGRNGTFLPLEPLGGERFFFRQLYVEIVARRDAKGSVDALLWGGSYAVERISQPRRPNDD